MLIFFFGLILFTMDTHSGHPIAILPRFDQPTPLRHDGILEPHTAVIMFPRDSHPKAKHWRIHDDFPDVYFVELRTSVLNFSGSGGTPTVPPDLIHVKTDCCPTLQDIDSAYLPGATSPKYEAVAQIDHGTLESGSLDGAALTLWTINKPVSPTGHRFTISDGFHELELDWGTIIFIVNVPFERLNPDAQYKRPATEHDFEAYYLLAPGGIDCFKHPTGGSGETCDQHSSMRKIAMSRKLRRSRDWTTLFQHIKNVDSECSNSQYP